MSERVVIEFEQVGKMYRLYKSRLQSFLDATSLGQLVPRWNTGIDNFWALRNVSFKLKAGSRLGIIGRNGAGKTTLLKLMTGNLTPTEGQIAVRGDVQALLEAGAGFHPEFSGFENIEASLIQNGFSRAQIKAAIDEIGDFTELGDFLRQPFKTYSAGMQARLVFTTATAVQPDILIIDEILGAGDAYFAVKSRSRMRELVEGGASVLLVSHALDQILEFCDEAIWLERGRIVLRGPSMEVVKAYEEFVHNLQDRQLKAANRQRKLGFRDAVEIGHFADHFIVALSLTGAPGVRADIGRIEQGCEDLAEEVLRVGDPQDSDQTHLSYVALNTGDWGDPEIEVDGAFRSLTRTEGAANPTLGEAVFRSYALEPGKRYAFRICYRIIGEGQLTATVSRNGQAIVIDEMLPIDGAAWQVHDLALPLAPVEEEAPITIAEFAIEGAAPNLAQAVTRARAEPMAAARSQRDAAAASLHGRKMTVRRWPGEGNLLIDDVVLQAADGSERAVYTVGSALTIRLAYRALESGTFPIMCSIVIFRIDGIRVTQHISPCDVLNLSAGERREAQLEFPSLDLADGRYVISVALHRELDPQRPNDTLRYDLLDRSYEFEIIGNPPLRTSLVVLPAQWSL